MMSKPPRPVLALLLLAAAAPRAGAASAADRGSTVRLRYALYGHGLHALDIAVDLRLTPDGYSVRLRDHTTGFLSLMLHTDVTSAAIGRFTAGGVQPLRFESAGYSRGARRDTVLDYADGNPVVRVQTPAETRRDPVDIAQARGAIDTLSAMADLVQQVRRSGHCDGQALVFDGLRLTQVRSRTAGEQAVPPDDRSPYAGSALRCDFTSQQTAGFLHDSDEQQARKPQHGTAWVTRIVPGAPALPVRITFENPRLGLATMFLKQADTVPADAAPAGPGG